MSATTGPDSRYHAKPIITSTDFQQQSKQSGL
jgi:hypothetical protein